MIISVLLLGINVSSLMSFVRSLREASIRHTLISKAYNLMRDVTLEVQVEGDFE